MVKLELKKELLPLYTNHKLSISTTSSHEKIDPPEKYPTSSTEEIYLIDDEISDQPLLTFCGGQKNGDSFQGAFILLIDCTHLFIL